MILHLGDHDPSGIDMTRDIEDRLRTFIYIDYARAHYADLPREGLTFGAISNHMRENLRVPDYDGLEFEPFEVRRIALNMDQVEEYNPPPNPAKLTDSRAAGYVAEHGDESWELDALDPDTLDELIREHVDGIRDDSRYEVAQAMENNDRQILDRIAYNYDDVATMFGEDTGE